MGDNDFNAGQGGPNAGAGADLGAGAGAGNGSGDGGQNNPGSQNGQQTDPRDAELAKLRQDNKALNKALIDSRRNSNQNRNPLNRSGQNGQGQGQENLMDTPEGQYSVALQLATGQLREKMEDVYSLYPEIPATELQRIRRNPWAFASQKSYMAGDVDAAALEIEQALLDRAEEIKAAKAGGNNQPSQPANGQQANGRQPAQINNNPAGGDQEPAAPGTAEDTNPWTMPMEKLARVKNKQLAQATKK